MMSPIPPAAGADPARHRVDHGGPPLPAGRQALQGVYLIDINAMVFGMPRALFPALAATVFHGGAGHPRLPLRRPGGRGACSAPPPPGG